MTEVERRALRRLSNAPAGTMLKLTLPGEQWPRDVRFIRVAEQNVIVARDESAPEEPVPLAVAATGKLLLPRKGSPAKQGAIIGAAVLGLTCGSTFMRFDAAMGSFAPRLGSFLAGAMIAAIPGAIVGALIGWAIGGQGRWIPIVPPLDTPPG